MEEANLKTCKVCGKQFDYDSTPDAQISSMYDEDSAHGEESTALYWCSGECLAQEVKR